MSKQYKIKAIIRNKRGHILSIGFNSYTCTHPMQKKYGSMVGTPEKEYRHAEIHAISLCKPLSQAYSIEVSRYLKNGQEALAKPCRACEKAIQDAGIKVIQYTRDNYVN